MLKSRSSGRILNREFRGRRLLQGPRCACWRSSHLRQLFRSRSDHYERDVAAGQTVARDIGLTSKSYDKDGHQTRGICGNGEKEGSAKAIMDQRAAANMKTVMAADAFGDVSEGNLGEFLKTHARRHHRLLMKPTPDMSASAHGSQIHLRVDGRRGNRVRFFIRSFREPLIRFRATVRSQAWKTIEMSKTPRASDSGSALRGCLSMCAVKALSTRRVVASRTRLALP